jgi:hypothetical protein
MHPADFEQLVHRELRLLPTPRAPRTLLPRVLAAVRQWSERPWYARAWFTWPRAWQGTSIAALVVLLAGSAVLVPSAQAAARRVALTSLSGALGDVTGIAQRAEVAVNAARVLWRALLEPFVAYAFALVVLMCLACAACGAALTRVAFGRTVPS